MNEEPKKPLITHPWTDVKSLAFGSDEQYLYFKFEFWGTFPDKGVTYKGDYVHDVGAKIEDLKFTDAEGKNDSGELSLNVTYLRDGRKPGKAATGMLAMVSPTGELDDKMEIIWRVYSGEGLISGGAGSDYILTGFPLSKFGIKTGDEITFHSSSESGSDKFHHESADQVLDSGLEKSGDTIVWKLGESTFRRITQKEIEKAKYEKK